MCPRMRCNPDRDFLGKVVWTHYKDMQQMTAEECNSLQFYCNAHKQHIPELCRRQSYFVFCKRRPHLATNCSPEEVICVKKMLILVKELELFLLDLMSEKKKNQTLASWFPVSCSSLECRILFAVEARSPHLLHQGQSEYRDVCQRGFFRPSKCRLMIHKPGGEQEGV